MYYDVLMNCVAGRYYDVLIYYDPEMNFEVWNYYEKNSAVVMFLM